MGSHTILYKLSIAINTKIIVKSGRMGNEHCLMSLSILSIEIWIYHCSSVVCINSCNIKPDVSIHPTMC